MWCGKASNFCLYTREARGEFVSSFSEETLLFLENIISNNQLQRFTKYPKTFLEYKEAFHLETIKDGNHQTSCVSSLHNANKFLFSSFSMTFGDVFQFQKLSNKTLFNSKAFRWIGTAESRFLSSVLPKHFPKLPLPFDLYKLFLIKLCRWLLWVKRRKCSARQRATALDLRQLCMKIFVFHFDEQNIEGTFMFAVQAIKSSRSYWFRIEQIWLLYIGNANRFENKGLHSSSLSKRAFELIFLTHYNLITIDDLTIDC